MNQPVDLCLMTVRSDSNLTRLLPDPWPSRSPTRQPRIKLHSDRRQIFCSISQSFDFTQCRWPWALHMFLVTSLEDLPSLMLRDFLSACFSDQDLHHLFHFSFLRLLRLLRLLRFLRFLLVLCLAATALSFDIKYKFQTLILAGLPQIC